MLASVATPTTVLVEDVDVAAAVGAVSWHALHDRRAAGCRPLVRRAGRRHTQRHPRCGDDQLHVSRHGDDLQAPASAPAPLATRAPCTRGACAASCRQGAASRVRRRLCQRRHARADVHLGREAVLGQGCKIRPRTWDSVVLDAKTKAALLDDIDEFTSAEAQRWYTCHGVPRRRGYSSTARPHWKTSSVLAIARSGRRAHRVNLVSPGLTDNGLILAVNLVKPGGIVVFEDVDALWGPPGKGEAFSVTFSGLLNAIDGLGDTSRGLIFVLTSNVERLDPALVRKVASIWCCALASAPTSSRRHVPSLLPRAGRRCPPVCRGARAARLVARASADHFVSTAAPRPPTRRRACTWTPWRVRRRPTSCGRDGESWSRCSRQRATAACPSALSRATRRRLLVGTRFVRADARATIASYTASCKVVDSPLCPHILRVSVCLMLQACPQNIVALA